MRVCVLSFYVTLHMTPVSCSNQIVDNIHLAAFACFQLTCNREEVVKEKMY